MRTEQKVFFSVLLIITLFLIGFYTIYYSNDKTVTELKDAKDLIEKLKRNQTNFQQQHQSQQPQPNQSTDVSNLKKELDEKEQKLIDVTKTLQTIKKIHHLKFVILTKDEVHERTRILVGSIHAKHKDIKIIVYGIKLHPNSIGELKLWSHVEYVDIDDFLASNKLVEPNEKDTLDLSYWKPVVLYHAAQRYGKVLLVDNHYILSETIYKIEEKLEKYGSYFIKDKDTKEDYIQCSSLIQGYKYDSFAFKNILTPQVKCGYKFCTKDQMGLMNEKEPPEEYKEALACNEFPSEFIPQKSDHRPLVCSLIFRDDFLYSYSQLPKFPGQNKKKSDGKVHIAIGFPSTSKGNANPNENNIAPITVLIPSFLATIKKDDAKYFYNLYLAFDNMDPYYDNLKHREALQKKIDSMISGYPVKFEFVRCRQTYGWTTFLWNVAFQHAIHDGNDYFYQVNDDLRFIDHGWSDTFTQLLENNPAKKYVGVVGPLDTNNGGIFTQAFVHRTHYDIFGYFYPPIFRNWYSDDWITRVYTPAKSTFKTQTKVHNSQVAGTRYQNCDGAGKFLPEALATGARLIENFIKEK